MKMKYTFPGAIIVAGLLYFLGDNNPTWFVIAFLYLILIELIIIEGLLRKG